MEAVVQQAIKTAESKKRASVPWKADEPWKQPYYRYSNNDWQRYEATNTITMGPSHITKLAIFSWNIDFMLPFPDSRMSKAIDHLRSQIQMTADTGVIVYLQECVATDLKLIASHEWVRESFAMSDISKENWQSGHYGTITLADLRLPITSSFRVHYSQTRMERDLLVLDVRIKDKTIRLCNSHLESLALEPPYRIPQMKLIAQYMRDQAVHGAVAAGDFNAIQPFDKTLHSDNDLQDAYLLLGGNEDDASGHTWGQQAATFQRERFGTSRMDKIFFCGRLGLRSFERFGADVIVEDREEQVQLVNLGFDKPWITDHLGVMATFDAGHVREHI